MSDVDLAAGSAFEFGQEHTLGRLRNLITKLQLEGKEVSQEIKDFCEYDKYREGENVI